jgi:hypothetical protein
MLFLLLQGGLYVLGHVIPRPLSKEVSQANLLMCNPASFRAGAVNAEHDAILKFILEL